MTAKTFQLGTTGEDRARWIALLDRLPRELRDLHFHPDYMRIYELTYADEAVLLVHEDENGFIMQPFIVRTVPDETAQDLTSVYGYGGPLAQGTPSTEAFQRALKAWGAQNNYVSEYCLLSPFTTEAQTACLPSDLAIEKRKDVVVADLRQPMHALWSNIEERQRKACAAARRKGIIIEASDLSDEDFEDFQTRYLRTMDQVGASDFWKFPDTYFSNCRDALGRENVTLLNATFEGQRIATFFHIHMFDTVYYHFACADPAYRNLNPTSLLLLDSLIWAKSAGFKWFHMGGGRTTGRDSLFTFKYSYCRQTLPLYGYTHVLDDAAYDKLVTEKLARERTTDGAERQTDFFPRYRG